MKLSSFSPCPSYTWSVYFISLIGDFFAHALEEIGRRQYFSRSYRHFDGGIEINEAVPSRPILYQLYDTMPPPPYCESKEYPSDFSFLVPKHDCFLLTHPLPPSFFFLKNEHRSKLLRPTSMREMPKAGMPPALLRFATNWMLCGCVVLWVYVNNSCDCFFHSPLNIFCVPRTDYCIHMRVNWIVCARIVFTIISGAARTRSGRLREKPIR